MAADGFGYTAFQTDAVGSGSFCKSNTAYDTQGMGIHVGIFATWKASGSQYSLTLSWNLGNEQGSFYDGTGYGIQSGVPTCGGSSIIELSYGFGLWDQTTQAPAGSWASDLIMAGWAGGVGVTCSTVMDASFWSYNTQGDVYPFAAGVTSYTWTLAGLPFNHSMELRVYFLGYEWVSQSGQGGGTLSSTELQMGPQFLGVTIT